MVDDLCIRFPARHLRSWSAGIRSTQARACNSHVFQVGGADCHCLRCTLRLYIHLQHSSCTPFRIQWAVNSASCGQHAARSSQHSAHLTWLRLRVGACTHIGAPCVLSDAHVVGLHMRSAAPPAQLHTPLGKQAAGQAGPASLPASRRHPPTPPLRHSQTPPLHKAHLQLNVWHAPSHPSFLQVGKDRRALGWRVRHEWLQRVRRHNPRRDLGGLRCRGGAAGAGTPTFCRAALPGTRGAGTQAGAHSTGTAAPAPS